MGKSSASRELEADGYTVLRGVLKASQVETLSLDVQRVFAQYPPDVRDPDDDAAQTAPFRYEMLNRSALVQRAIGTPRILRTIEPLLGEDCHVIANTAWWQPPGNNEHLGRFWHTDAGPHIPRDPGVPWDPRIRIRSSLSLPTSSCGIARWKQGPPRHTPKPHIRTASTDRPAGRRNP